MIVESIYKAIQDRFQDSPLTAMVEGLYFVRAPCDQTGNYIVFTPITQHQEYDMSSRLESMLIQFRVWCEDNEESGIAAAVGIGEMLMTWFDDCTLTVGGGTLVRIDRESHNCFPDPDGGWIYQIDYALLAQEVS